MTQIDPALHAQAMEALEKQNAQKEQRKIYQQKRKEQDGFLEKQAAYNEKRQLTLRVKKLAFEALAEAHHAEYVGLYEHHMVVEEAKAKRKGV